MTNAILGGGISGLSAAYYLSKSAKNGMKLYESSNRLGGWIKSSITESGTIFEQGPRTIRCAGPAAANTLSLVIELGLLPKVRPVFRTDEAAKNQLIYFGEELIKLPRSWTALFRINPPFIKPFMFAIVNDLKTPKKDVADESIYDFVSRRFGREYADVPLSAMICGIFAGDAKEISVKALMNGLFEKEQKYGGVCKGFFHSIKNSFLTGDSRNKKRESKPEEFKKWSVWSLENGLETLPKNLAIHLTKSMSTEIHLNSKCSEIAFKNNEVLLNINGKTHYAEHVHSSIPSIRLAEIIPNEHRFLKQELSLIPFVTVATINLEYEGDVLSHKGFGFLVPPSQNLPILGIIFDSCIFPKAGKTVLTIMMGGKWFKHHFGAAQDDNNNFLEIGQNYVKKILKIDKEPLNALVTIMKDCIPQYVVGHSDRVRRIRDYIAERKLPLTLMGNSFDGIGVNDAILSAKVNVKLSEEKKLFS